MPPPPPLPDTPADAPREKLEFADVAAAEATDTTEPAWPPPPPSDCTKMPWERSPRVWTLPAALKVTLPPLPPLPPEPPIPNDTDRLPAVALLRERPPWPPPPPTDWINRPGELSPSVLMVMGTNLLALAPKTTEPPLPPAPPSPPTLAEPPKLKLALPVVVATLFTAPPAPPPPPMLWIRPPGEFSPRVARFRLPPLRKSTCPPLPPLPPEPPNDIDTDAPRLLPEPELAKLVELPPAPPPPPTD